jgi:preprotein translocase subunit YajC
VNIMLLTIMAQEGGKTGFGGSALFIQLGLIALVFYFLIIRPQSQSRKKHEALLQDLKKGDDVVTSGGLMGKVKAMDGTRITVESGTAEVTVHRQKIVQVGDAVAPGGGGR